MKKRFAAAILLASLPFAASARDSLGSYTYVEGGFNQLNVDNDIFADLDFSGVYLRGSVGLTDSLYLYGGYAGSQNSDFADDIDAHETHLGIGYAYPMFDNVDLIAEAAFQRQEFDTAGVSDSASNSRLGVGVRGAISNSVEGWVKANYVDGGNYDGDFIGTLGAQFVLNETWGIVGEIEAGSVSSRYTIGVRASF